MKTTTNLYFKLTGILIILLFCKIQTAHATEFSPLFGLGQENFTFIMQNIEGGKSNMTFEPNISGISRVGATAFGFSAGYSFRNSNKDLDPALGSTTFSDWQLDYQSSNWGIDAFFQSYKGFYTRDTDLTQLHPDLQFQHYGLMGRWAMEESEFTVSGLYDQSEPITTTAGKWYLMGGFHQYRMNTPISLMQQDYAGINQELEDMRGLSSTSLNFGVGAGKYWVSDNHLFVGILADIFATYGLYDYKFATEETTHSNYMTLSYDLKFGVGYAGENFKFGLGTSADLVTLRTSKKTQFQSISARALIYLRYVF